MYRKKPPFSRRASPSTTLSEMANMYTSTDAASKPPAQTSSGCGPFGLCAPLLIRNGYSPIPIQPASKRPLSAIGDWSRLPHRLRGRHHDSIRGGRRQSRSGGPVAPGVTPMRRLSTPRRRPLGVVQECGSRRTATHDAQSHSWIPVVRGVHVALTRSPGRILLRLASTH